MFNFITQAIELLTRPPGDLVYYLIILFAIEAMLGLAVVHARRPALPNAVSGWTRQLRLIALAAGVMLIGRVVLIAVALLVQQNQALIANAILPPLERYVDLISLTFLVLAFVPLLRERSQLGLGLTAIMLVTATIFYALSATQWYNLSAVPNQFYNVTPQETIWQAWSLAVAALAAVVVWLSRDDTVGLTFAAFLTLALGSLLQLVWADAQSNVAGWVRLALHCLPGVRRGRLSNHRSHAHTAVGGTAGLPLAAGSLRRDRASLVDLDHHPELEHRTGAGRFVAAHGFRAGTISTG